MDCRFNSTEERALRNSSSPLYKGSLICGEDLTISFHQKKVVEMKQCWALGFSILELSKWHMQYLYYDKIVPALGEGNVAVVMSDTDSFLLATNYACEDEVMGLLAPHMDFSNLSEDHFLYCKDRCRTPGFLKNEVPKGIISEVVALKSKTYVINTLDGETVSRAKGVTEKSKKKLTLKHYKKCLDEIAKVEVKEHTIRSKNHINQLLESEKVAFSSFDDKRFLTCPKHSAPYGSRLIKRKKCYFCTHPDELY
jgi:hypothetical protein